MTPHNSQIICKTCDIGTLYKIRKHRMSGVVVVIGYILLIPSILGVLLMALSVAMLHTGTATSSSAGASLADGVLVAFAIAFFVSGLVGWLLVMKKDILQCGHCGATIAAS